MSACSEMRRAGPIISVCETPGMVMAVLCAAFAIDFFVFLLPRFHLAGPTVLSEGSLGRQCYSVLKLHFPMTRFSVLKM